MAEPAPLRAVPDVVPEHDSLAHAFMLRSEALERGSSDRALARGVKEGDLVKLRQGAYSPMSVYAALDPLQQHALLARAVLKQSRTELVLSHVSALVELGGPEWGLDLTQVHVTRLDRRAGRAEAGVRQHRSRLEPTDQILAGGVPLTSPTRTALDLTKILGQEAALCQVNYLLNAELTTRELLEERYATMHRDPGTLGTGLLLKMADGRLENVAESRTWHAMYRFDVPLPVPQLEIHDERGRLLGRLDFAWPKRGKWLEFDGLGKYRSPHRPGETPADVVIREKRREDEIRRVTGWRCMRITWRDLADPAALARRILTFLAEP